MFFIYILNRSSAAAVVVAIAAGLKLLLAAVALLSEEEKWTPHCNSFVLAGHIAFQFYHMQIYVQSSRLQLATRSIVEKL